MAGTMRERTPGVWMLRAYAGRDPVSGRKRYVGKQFRGSKREAGRALARLVTDVGSDQVDTSKATVGYLLDRWLEQIEPTRAPKTLHEYRSKIKGRIRPALGDVRLDKLRPDRLDGLYAGWLREGLSPTTVHHLHAIIAAALNQAVKWGWITSSPAARATPPPLRAKPLTIPTPEALDALYGAAMDVDPVLGTAIALAGLTGARRGELCALRWSDIDMVAGTVRIRRSLSVVGRSALEGPTKTHQERMVTLFENGVGLLRDRWAAQQELAALAGSPMVEDPYVLSYNANAGEPVFPDTITHRFQSIVKAQGMVCRFHDLRHYSASSLMAAGMDNRTITDRHGWANMAMLNRYTHALPERDRAAAEVLDRAFGG